MEFFQTKCKEYSILPTRSLLEEIINIYIQQILPLIEEKHRNNYHLIKTIYTIENIEMLIEAPEIIHWVEGLPAKKKLKKEKTEEPKPKKNKTVKVLTEEQLVKPIKPKKMVKKKIGTIQLQEEAKGEAEEEEEEKEEEEKEEKEEKRRIQIMEDKNTFHVGTTDYPEDYFHQEEEDDLEDDEFENEPIIIGDLFDGNLNEEKL